MGLRGRPASANTERLETRVTVEESDELSRIAAAAGVPRAELIRDLVRLALTDLATSIPTTQKGSKIT